MLTDLETALDHPVNRGRELIDFQVAADMMLTRQFIYRGDHGCMRAAETILANRAYFENLLLATGRRLIVDTRIGMVGTVPLDVRGRRLRLDETLLLLALRFVYSEGIPSRMDESAEMVATTEEVVGKLEELSRRQRPEWKRLGEMLDLFETLGFVKQGGTVEDDDRNRELVLRPGLLHAVPRDFLDRLEEFAAEADTRARSADAGAPIPDDEPEDDTSKDEKAPDEAEPDA
jgi:hypothetical protein